MKFSNFKNLQIFRTVILKNICECLLLKFIKNKTPTQVFSCKFCEIFKNTCFVEDLHMAGSETQMLGSLFDKVVDLTAQTHITVSETEAATRGVL